MTILNEGLAVGRIVRTTTGNDEDEDKGVLIEVVGEEEDMLPARMPKLRV